MQFCGDRVRVNAREASTEDLLDRITAYRAGMEIEAIEIIETELRSRDVNQNQIDAHGSERAKEVLHLPDGTALSCSLCRRPAVTQVWSWHWLLGRVPVFPRRFFYCRKHIESGGAVDHCR
jgi:hypothetical protein